MNIQWLPPLIVNGEGGDRLDKEIAPVLTWGLGNLTIIGKPFVEPRFGFGVYTRTKTGWSISLRDANGNEGARCTLESGSVRCLERAAKR